MYMYVLGNLRSQHMVIWQRGSWPSSVCAVILLSLVYVNYWFVYFLCGALVTVGGCGGRYVPHLLLYPAYVYVRRCMLVCLSSAGVRMLVYLCGALVKVVSVVRRHRTS